METSFEEQLRREYEAHPRVKLRKSWGEFVARWPWQWFVTLTFTADTHEERALKLYHVWVCMLNKFLFGPRWHKRPPFGVYYVVATELQKSGRVHIHALFAGIGNTRRLDWMDRWLALDELAGFPRIFPVENIDAVSNYVTKYVTKGGNVWFSNNLRDITNDLFATAAGSTDGRMPERIAPGIGSTHDGKR